MCMIANNKFRNYVYFVGAKLTTLVSDGGTWSFFAFLTST